MASKVLRGILSFAERVVGWRCQNLCAVLFRVLKVLVDMVNMHAHVLANLVRTRRPKLCTVMRGEPLA